MLIGNKLIKQSLQDNKLKVSYAPEANQELNIGTNSIDVTLAKDIYVTGDYREEVNPPLIDPNSNEPLGHLYKPVSINTFGYTLAPNDFILASVEQAFDCDVLNWCQMYEGRSTLARLGILTHVSAGFGDVGFKGAFTLEIKNLSPHHIVLHQGMRIGQVYFEEVTDVDTKYNGYDQTDFKPQLPRLGKGRF